MQRPALSAIAELLKPITWFPPMWAFACGVVASGLPAEGRWPLIVAGVLSAAVLTFAHTLGEFGVVLMVGGSIAGETKTLSIAIYDRVQAFDLASAKVVLGARAVEVVDLRSLRPLDRPTIIVVAEDGDSTATALPALKRVFSVSKLGDAPRLVESMT